MLWDGCADPSPWTTALENGGKMVFLFQRKELGHKANYEPFGGTVVVVPRNENPQHGVLVQDLPPV